MSGDRLLDDYEREALVAAKKRRSQLRDFADAVEAFAFDQLGITFDVRRLNRDEKLLLMKQFCDEIGTASLDIWLFTEKEKDDFFWESLEHLEGKNHEIDDVLVDDEDSKEYQAKLKKLTEELRYFIDDFLPEGANFDKKTDRDKLATLHQFNERIGLKESGIWVLDEDNFLKNYLFFISKDPSGPSF